jgi:large subunit ribosomal protein L15
MRTHKKSKKAKMRAHTTFGFGSKKKHRGHGHRGGAGNAGTGKRSDSKKPSIWGQERYFGKFGFKTKNPLCLKTVSIAVIEGYIHKFPSAKETKQGIELDLGKEGYDKLLGNGKPTKAYLIKVDYASKGAKEKIEKAGGQLTLSVEQVSDSKTQKPSEPKASKTEEPKPIKTPKPEVLKPKTEVSKPKTEDSKPKAAAKKKVPAQEE